MDNLDIQGRSSDEEEQKTEEDSSPPPGPPPPPALPSSTPKIHGSPTSATTPETESPKPLQQPLATISIHDLTSVQLRRTNIKMHASKTFSAPPPRSVSMTNGKLNLLLTNIYYHFYYYSNYRLSTR